MCLSIFYRSQTACVYVSRSNVHTCKWPGVGRDRRIESSMSSNRATTRHEQSNLPRWSSVSHVCPGDATKKQRRRGQKRREIRVVAHSSRVHSRSMINHHHHSFLGDRNYFQRESEWRGEGRWVIHSNDLPSFDHQRSLIFSPPAPPVALANRSETRRSLASQFCFRFGVPLPFYSFPFGAFHAILSQRGREARGMSGHSRSGNSVIPLSTSPTAPTFNLALDHHHHRPFTFSSCRPGNQHQHKQP